LWGWGEVGKRECPALELGGVASASEG